MGRLVTLAPRLKVLDSRTTRPPPKQADSELQTAEHRAWRLAVLNRAHWRCEDCGKQGGKGSSVTLYADHIRERRDGGAPLDLANGRCLCSRCHSSKTAIERAKRLAEPVASLERD